MDEITPQEVQIEEQKPNRPKWYVPILKLLIYLFTVETTAVIASVMTSRFASLLGLHTFEVGLGEDLVTEFAMLIAALLITYAFVVLVDRRPAWTLGLDFSGKWILELAFGVLSAVLSVGLFFILTYAFGWIRITGSLFLSSPLHIVSILIQTILLMTAIAFFEEITSRG